MSERGKIRIELNIATALLILAAFALTAMTGLAQLPDTVTAVKTLAGLDTTELMAFVALLALGLCGYLIRLLFGRLLTALDANTRSNSDLAKLLAERPCIRDPQND